MKTHIPSSIQRVPVDPIFRRGRKSRWKRSQSGAALLAVMWIIALLITLVATLSLLLVQDVDAAATRRQIFRARTLAETGLALATHPDVKPDDPLLHQTLGEGERFDVSVVGEDGKLNPNVLLQKEDRETLRRVFRFWGMDLMQSDALIDALLDWVDGDTFQRPRGAEARAYGNNAGMPFNRPFRNLEEMTLVRGMREVDAAYPEWRRWFSIYASGVVDLNEAEPEVISAVTGADPMLARQFAARVLGRDGIRNTQDDVRAEDLQTAGRLLGISIPAGATGLPIGVTSNIRRIDVIVHVGDHESVLSAVTTGSATGGPVTLIDLREN